MKKSHSGLIRLTLLVAMLAGLVACATRPAGRYGEPAQGGQEPLRVGMTPNYPPMIFKQDGQVTGAEADFAAALGAALDRPVRFVELSWEKLIPALQDRRIDIIMSGMTITAPRAALVAFTQPYIRVGQLPLIRTDDAPRFSTPVSVMVTDKRIGVEKGTTGDNLVQQECRRANRVPFSSAQAAAKALLKGKVDVVIHDAPMIWWLAGQYNTQGLTFSPALLTEEYLAWGVHPDNPELLEQANALLEQWDTNGTMDQVLGRWLPYQQ
ncbi:MAG: transporter substrate-binding domain-containing protein [Spartobacteria bacterium]|nr:transporter substrate-binding domain-containing protein [Spartobacteria bacterium]